ncbi:MAG TPA: mechanosensitive ion channel family protein [Thioalkalivibrio sp.]|nr:mechanosensitive ion channel family protein [Thioalkalivibrio sp.]
MAQEGSRSIRKNGLGPWLLGLLLAALAGTVLAQDQAAEWTREAAESLQQIENRLAPVDPETADAGAIGAALREVGSLRTRAQQCVTTAEEAIKKLDATLASLGEAQQGEPAEVTRERRDLEQQRAAQEQTLSTCRLLGVQAQRLSEVLAQGQQAILASRLLARGPDAWTVLKANLIAPGQWLISLWRLLELEESKGLPDLRQWLLTLGMLILGAAAGFGLRRLLFRRDLAARDQAGIAANFALALAVQTRRDLPVWGALALPAIYLLIALPVSPLPLVTAAAVGLALFALLISLISVLLVPHAPATDWLMRPADAARALGRRLKALAALGLVGYLLFVTSLRDALSPDLYLLARGIYGTVLILNLVDIVWLLRRASWALVGRLPRLALMAALLGMLLAEYLGYRNLASYLLGGTMGSLFALAIAMLASLLLTDLYNGIDEGRLGWQRRLRARLGLKSHELVPGLTWLRLFTLVVIWGGFLLWITAIWGFSQQGQSLLVPYLTGGFTIGSLNIVPAYLLGGLAAFALLLNLSRYIKQHLIPRWLRHTRMDMGAREAVASVTGYIGIAVAALVALSIAGFEMQNLAIIAGALSVGIGFGLQNIVNNFVSGLILLFERPIRRGDWIVAGGTEGYVKSINIRSTQIQTFDRADVIVPNSELISQQVTNWMLADKYGRVVVPVGVSYDSDPEQVRDILTAVAEEHPLVLKGHPELADPRVLFRQFGDSSLDFELRFFITEVDQRLTTISEINFEIFRAFKREGIEIPYPQRDLHLRSWPGREGGEENPTLPPRAQD